MEDVGDFKGQIEVVVNNKVAKEPIYHLHLVMPRFYPALRVWIDR